MEIRQNQATACHSDWGRDFFRTATRPHGRPWWATPRNRWNDAETTALQHGRRPWRTAATTWSPSADSRRRTPAIDGGVAQTCRRWTDGGPRDGHGRDLPEAWNRIKASLSVFQRWEVKVLGFSVKTRPRPQRMAYRGYLVRFALVGAIGEACGEAPRVSFSGTPPLCWGGSPRPFFENRSRLSASSAAFMCRPRSCVNRVYSLIVFIR